MRQTILRFGFIAAAILLLLVVGEYSLFLKPRASAWIIAAAAVGLLAAGMWLGRYVLSIRESSPKKAPEQRISELGVSPREYEVLRLVADGLSNQEIAERLYISESTVKSHVSSLLTKLEAKRRTHAVRKARHLGLLI